MQDDKVIQNMDEQNEPQGDEVSWMDESGAEPQEVPATENEADAEDSDFEPDMEEPSQEEYTESSESAEFKYDPQELASILRHSSSFPETVPIKRLKEVVETEPREIRNAIEVLSKRYEEMTGFRSWSGGGFQLRTRPVFSTYINRFLERKRKFHSVDRLWNAGNYCLQAAHYLSGNRSHPRSQCGWRD